jgi:hypothetical protein
MKMVLFEAFYVTCVAKMKMVLFKQYVTCIANEDGLV